MAINNDDIPSDNRGAETSLRGMKSSLIGIVERLAVGDIRTIEQLSDYCWADINEINERIDG